MKFIVGTPGTLRGGRDLHVEERLSAPEEQPRTVVRHTVHLGTGQFGPAEQVKNPDAGIRCRIGSCLFPIARGYLKDYRDKSGMRVVARVLESEVQAQLAELDERLNATVVKHQKAITALWAEWQEILAGAITTAPRVPAPNVAATPSRHPAEEERERAEGAGVDDDIPF
jgi:hypothetical protein